MCTVKPDPEFWFHCTWSLTSEESLPKDDHSISWARAKIDFLPVEQFSYYSEARQRMNRIQELKNTFCVMQNVLTWISFRGNLLRMSWVNFRNCLQEKKTKQQTPGKNPHQNPCQYVSPDFLNKSELPTLPIRLSYSDLWWLIYDSLKDVQGEQIISLQQWWK